MASPDKQDLNQRFADLDQAAPTTVDITPTAAQVETLRQQLDLLRLSKVRLNLTLTPSGKQDWDLRARLGATVVQPCVVTLDPVTTRIETDLHRRYAANARDLSELTAPEAEMPPDTDTEPLGDSVDLLALIAEELALALPPFPRKPDAHLEQSFFAEPGTDPMTDEDAKPFAVLAQLRDKDGQGPRD